MAVFISTLLWLACGVSGLVACAVREDSRAQSTFIGLAAIAGGLGILSLLFAATN